MTGATMNHLTDEQMNDALLGDLAAEAAAHLALCQLCQQQLAEARMPMESFKAVTLAWSERRSATMPVSLQQRMLHHANGSRRRAWMTAAVAVLALAVAVPYGMRWQGRDAGVATEAGQTVSTTKTLASEANAEQIARDNQMLNEIDLELDSSRTSSEAMELQDMQGVSKNPVSRQTIQD